MNDVISAEVVEVAAPALVPASKGKRVAAALIDLLLIPLVIGMAWGFLCVALKLQTAMTVGSILLNAGWLVVRDAAFAPGRKMVNIQLVNLEGGAPTVGQAILRNIHLMIPFVLVLAYLVELIMLLSTGRRLADGWAKTMVVDVAPAA